jgi:hypothetical protein
VTRRELLRAAALAAPLLLGAPPRRAPLALATADTEGFVAVVDLPTGRLRGRVRTLDAPRSIESRGRGPVVVAHTAAGAVTLLERGGDRLHIRRVLRGFEQPR